MSKNLLHTPSCKPSLLAINFLQYVLHFYLYLLLTTVRSFANDSKKKGRCSSYHSESLSQRIWAWLQGSIKVTTCTEFSRIGFAWIENTLYSHFGRSILKLINWQICCWSVKPDIYDIYDRIVVQRAVVIVQPHWDKKNGTTSTLKWWWKTGGVINLSGETRSDREAIRKAELRELSEFEQSRANSLGVPSAAGEQQGPGRHSRRGSQMTIIGMEGCGWRASLDELVTARTVSAHMHRLNSAFLKTKKFKMTKK